MGKNCALYSGNIGEKQGLEKVIGAAERLRDRPLIFCDCRPWAARRGWRTYLRTRPRQILPSRCSLYDALPALLKMGDCHWWCKRCGAADAVLPSKLTNILAVGGNAVITAEPHTELGQLCARYPGTLSFAGAGVDRTRWSTGLAARRHAENNTTVSRIRRTHAQ